MTERDDIIRVLKSHYCNNCGNDAREPPYVPCDYCFEVRDALRKLKALDVFEELRLKLAEDLAEVRRTFGPTAQLSFEMTMISDTVLPTYSIGREARDAYAMTVDGRGATLAQAIVNARQLPLLRQR